MSTKKLPMGRVQNEQKLSEGAGNGDTKDR